MTKENENLGIEEIKEETPWDYNSHQGRSRRQVVNNENVAFYSTLAIAISFVVILVCVLLSQ